MYILMKATEWKFQKWLFTCTVSLSSTGEARIQSGEGFQQTTPGELNIHMQKSETEPLSYTMAKMHWALKHESYNHVTPKKQQGRNLTTIVLQWFHGYDTKNAGKQSRKRWEGSSHWPEKLLHSKRPAAGELLWVHFLLLGICCFPCFSSYTCTLTCAHARTLTGAQVQVHCLLNGAWHNKLCEININAVGWFLHWILAGGEKDNRRHPSQKISQNVLGYQRITPWFLFVPCLDKFKESQQNWLCSPWGNSFPKVKQFLASLRNMCHSQPWKVLP